MDGESSYESDISESWSLVDININEESFSVTEIPTESEKRSNLTDLENVKPEEAEEAEEADDLKLNDSVEKCEEIHKTNFDPLNASDSNSSFLSEGFVSSSYKDFDEVHSSCKRNVDDDRKNDSDVESIEILDMDGVDRDSEIDRCDSVIDSHDSQTYQSDDEESLEGNIKNESRNNSSTVINRKRKKCTKNTEDTVNSLNSENKRPEISDSKVLLSETDKDIPTKALGEGNSHPVCKHYRNNVANTVLSLSVGIIFAGVACLAIRHFLGVQDATESTGELVETLRKLQVENAALQSRLFHLNRALLNKEENSKSGPPPAKVSCGETPQTLKPKTEETDLNRAALSEIRSSLNSIEWLSKLQNLVRNDNGAAENVVDFKGFGMYIHDQLNFLRTKKEGGVKLLEDADRKISKVLQKIVNRLSASQENIEKLYHRLINLKDKINHKLNKILPDVPEDIREKNRNFEKRTPVTEHDLQSIQWKSEEKNGKNIFRQHPEPIVLYQFPQPEKYYQAEGRNVESTTEKKLDVTNSTETSKVSSFDKDEETEKKDKKTYKVESEKKKRRKRGRNNSKKAESKEKDPKSDNKEKKHKRTGNKSVAKQIEKGSKRGKKIVESEPVKFNFGSDFNKSDSEPPKYVKVDGEVLKSRGKSKKIEKTKVKKSSLSKAKKDFYGKRRFDRSCLGRGCFNSTGFWVFKWADGREEFRRHQKLGDWQFERAKGRKELRDEDFSVNWQFRRAVGRESNRHGGRWQREKYTRFNGKEFFHEGFSWI